MYDELEVVIDHQSIDSTEEPIPGDKMVESQSVTCETENSSEESSTLTAELEGGVEKGPFNAKIKVTPGEADTNRKKEAVTTTGTISQRNINVRNAQIVTTITVTFIPGGWFPRDQSGSESFTTSPSRASITTVNKK